MISFVSTAPSRWLLPFLIFSTIFGIFETIERVVRPEIRSDVAAYLVRGNYRDTMRDLPRIIETVFIQIFGKRHLTFFCLSRSIIISIFSIVFSFAFTFFYRPEAIVSIYDGAQKELPEISKKLSESPKLHHIGNFLGHIGLAGAVTLLLIFWILCCVIPDYISLLKSRIIILILRTNEENTFFYLLSILFFDFLISILVFMISFVLFQTIIVQFLVSLQTPGSFSNLSSFIMSSFIIGVVIFSLEIFFIISLKAILFTIPLANLFWASALPAAWLWLYIGSSFLARVFLDNQSRIARITEIIDVSGHPFRSLGVFAGAIGAFITFLFLIALSIFWAAYH